MSVMKELLAEIEGRGIAAPSPIEQRWSASSSSFMSPAYGLPDGLHSWVGIIMYLPTENEKQRVEIADSFRNEYCKLLKDVGYKVNAASHWAKLEVSQSPVGREELRKFHCMRYPVQLFNHVRRTFDPDELLTNDLMSASFGHTTARSENVNNANQE